MIVNKQLKLRGANFTAHTASHRDQNRQFHYLRGLDRRVVRDVANRARRIGAARVVVVESRPGHHEQQGKNGHAGKYDLCPAVPRICPSAHLLHIVRAKTPLDARNRARVCMNHYGVYPFFILEMPRFPFILYCLIV